MDIERLLRQDPEEVARITYTYEGTPGELYVHVFRATEWEPDSPTESEEMLPRWFGTDAVPFQEMWADDPHWYSLLLAGAKFEARFDFAQDMHTIVSKSVTLEAP